jgi:hypothetical protein
MRNGNRSVLPEESRGEAAMSVPVRSAWRASAQAAVLDLDQLVTATTPTLKGTSC